MRFFLDNDVPVSVARFLRARGHDTWTANEAGLADEDQDDNLTVYATERGAVLVTIDKEFSARRRHNPIGHHIRLRCIEPEAVAVLELHYYDVMSYLRRPHVMIDVSKSGAAPHSRWS